jgi:integrase
MSRQKDRLNAVDLLTLMEARPWKDGKTISYRYHPTGAKPIPLGTDRFEAVRKVQELLGGDKDHGTLKWLWQRYTKESPRWKLLAPLTQDDYRQAWLALEKSFGNMQVTQIDSLMVSHYVHKERASAPKRANTEKALLSNLFNFGVEEKVCILNATKGIQGHMLEPRSMSPNPVVLSNYLTWLSIQTRQRMIVGMAAEYASLAGSRKCEFLQLTWSQIDRQTGEIRTVRAKQRRKKRGHIVDVVRISPALDALLNKLQAIRKMDSQYVFTDRGNNNYSDRAFKTLWNRCIQDAITERVLTEDARFTFHDLRAFYVTKHKNTKGTLPDLHKNPETTARVYDRNKEVPRDAL